MTDNSQPFHSQSRHEHSYSIGQRGVFAVLLFCAIGLLLTRGAALMRQVRENVQSRDVASCLLVDQLMACMQAQVRLTEMVHNGSDEAKVYYDLGLLAQHQNDNIGAVMAFQRAVALEPNNAVFLTVLANQYYAVSDLSSGAHTLWRVLESECGTRSSSCYIQLGRLFMYNVSPRDASSAIKAYYKAIELGANSPTSWSLIALAYNADGRTDQAIAVLDEHKVVGWMADKARGDAYSSFGWLDDALAAYKRAITESPNDPWLWDNIATVYLDKGDMAQARLAWKRALEIAPGLAPALEGLRKTEAQSQ